MARRTSADPADSGIALLAFMCFVVAAIYGIADGCDWLDRRSCRVNGGTVQTLEHGEWRCTGAAPESK